MIFLLFDPVVSINYRLTDSLRNGKRFPLSLMTRIKMDDNNPKNAQSDASETCSTELAFGNVSPTLFSRIMSSTVVFVILYTHVRMYVSFIPVLGPRTHASPSSSFCIFSHRQGTLA